MAQQETAAKVFRLRNLPNRIASLSEAAQLLSQSLRIPIQDVFIRSVAKASNVWEKPPSKVATLQLRSDPGPPAKPMRSDEWEILVPEALGGRLILDTHFEGLTALNDLKPEEHHTDCIAISGLAGHAFGSWQPRGLDKSFMWIRDEVPRSVPGTRTIVYGYDSKLVSSNSFQTITDIALSLIHQLKNGGWNLESAKPIVFLAHSLGGLVLKDAIVQMADRDVATMLNRIQGAIMFGVPSLGMHTSHLMAMTEGQANQVLVQDLSYEDKSVYLRKLNKSFDGIIFVQHIQIYWAYETKETPTPKRLPDGRWDRNGPLAVLVNPDSATCYHNITNKFMTIPVDEDHSNIVKYSPGHCALTTVIASLGELCNRRPGDGLIASPFSKNSPNESSGCLMNVTKTQRGSSISLQDQQTIEKLDQLVSSMQKMYKEIYSPELDLRIDQIEDPYQDTFRWIFEQPAFCSWLQDGSGLFWVNGKPGSGKSTLMKYIFNSRHTQELLHDWRRGSSDIKEIKAGFFFHYRGTALQKSFEGLLRSVLIQLVTSQFQAFRYRWEIVGSLRRKESSIKDGIREATEFLEIVSTQLQELIQAGIDDDRMAEAEQKKRYIEKELENEEEQLFKVREELSGLAREFRQACDEPESRYLLDLTATFQRAHKELFLHKLENTLCHILDQDILKMDVVLFFDALDEFDGHLDMICRFLKSLDRSRDTATTRVKTCFSSRPWITFQVQFAEYPLLCLQDHTKYDIEKYAVGKLASYQLQYPSILELAPLILKRANGVFLWVKLAVQELINLVSPGTGLKSREQLEERLNDLPSDLDKFYKLIIERISDFHRRKTYSLLELIIRHRDTEPPLTVTDAWEAVHIAECHSFQEVTEVLPGIGVTSRNEPDVILPVVSVREQQMTDIATWSGGLVEIKRGHIQVMHQTVMEFVMSLSFRQIVLGDLATIVVENGHSLHFKYRCLQKFGLRNLSVKSIAYHAELSELTTGNSQLAFLETLPQKYIACLREEQGNSIGPEGDLLSILVSYGLSLGLRDWMTMNSYHFRRFCGEGPYLSLLDKLFFSSESHLARSSQLAQPQYYRRRVSMAQLLFSNGYNIDHDLEFLSTIITDIIAIEMSRPAYFEIPLPRLYELVELLLDHTHDPNLPMAVPNGRASAMHLAPPALAEKLIMYGADPNAVDTQGLTPFDYALKLSLLGFPSGAHGSTEWRYRKCMIDKCGRSAVAEYSECDMDQCPGIF